MRRSSTTGSEPGPIQVLLTNSVGAETVMKAAVTASVQRVVVLSPVFQVAPTAAT